MTHPAPTAIPRLLYGGDYNPEQWPRDVWRQDVRLMQRARVNFVSIGIFSWAWLEPRPGVFEFGWLDEVLGLLHEGGIGVNLATATASPPAWFSHMHPESLPVKADGSRMRQGARQHYAPANAAFRYYAERLVRNIARRYAEHPALVSWHVNNEYACHVWESFDPVTVQMFRHWLERRYGSIETLNERWGTAFWSQRYSSFDEIGPPAHLPTFANPAQALDWRRFSNWVLLDLMRIEIAAIRDHSPSKPINTNFLGFAPWLDYFEWAKELDYASWDSYPDPLGGQASVVDTAMAHDLTRSLKHKPFVLMEQATQQVNWRDLNAPKTPGQMRALSYQALAHGADGICFFQWRASRAGAEKFHSAMLPHGPIEPSRVVQEVCALGAELELLERVAGSETRADVALVFDWTSRWALFERSKPAAIDPVDECRHWYRHFHARNVTVDFAPAGAELSRYRLVVAPALYLLDAAAAAELTRFVQSGGTLVVTYFSGIVDENEQIGLGGYPALLRDLLGLWVEEWWPLPPSATQAVRFDEAPSDPPSVYGVERWSELVHPTSAESICGFTTGHLAQHPAVTRNSSGSGCAYYVATRLGAEAQSKLIDRLLADASVRGVLATPRGVEASLRHTGARRLLFLINHSEQPERVDLPEGGIDLLDGKSRNGSVLLEPRGVAVLEL
jgi:beta-galactosidase